MEKTFKAVLYTIVFILIILYTNVLTQPYYYIGVGVVSYFCYMLYAALKIRKHKLKQIEEEKVSE